MGIHHSGRGKLSNVPSDPTFQPMYSFASIRSRKENQQRSCISNFIHFRHQSSHFKPIPKFYRSHFHHLRCLTQLVNTLKVANNTISTHSFHFRCQYSPPIEPTQKYTFVRNPIHLQFYVVHFELQSHQISWSCLSHAFFCLLSIFVLCFRHKILFSSDT